VTTLLIADDDAEFRRATRVLLSGMVDEVSEAQDGAEAVETARRIRPDLILMDISMPAVNGLEATRRIKAELPATKIIVLTAHEAQAQRVSEPGVEAVITKRRLRSHLLPAVRALLGKARQLWDGGERRAGGAIGERLAWERRRVPTPAENQPQSDPRVSADVAAFLAERIEAWEELEALLLLRQRPTQYFHPAVVADRLQVTVECAIEALGRLARNGLVEGSAGEPRIAYRYRPASPKLAAQVDRLSAEYQERRVDVLRRLNADAIERVRSAVRRRRLTGGDSD
jgi:CheY-like chemotaxis protein